MLRNSKKNKEAQQVTQPLLGGNAPPGPQPAFNTQTANKSSGSCAGPKKNGGLSKAGRILIDLFYAITDVIPGMSLVPEVTDQELQLLDPFKAHVAIPYDSSDETHTAKLKVLWQACSSDPHPETLVSEVWKDFGFQGTDPATDFRGGGVFSLTNLLVLNTINRTLFVKVLNSSLPLAIAGINVTMMLLHLLQATKHKTCFSTSHNPNTVAARTARKNFVRILLSESYSASSPEERVKIMSMAFGEVYCIAFECLVKIWETEGGNIMNFNAILLKCRNAMEAKLRACVSIDELMTMET
eukprot:TRINITY_DN16763_c0_g1_i1.p1 TRINITY_DN16763_c0_g1~~TRINITY_DN16763_c0_g1_i1.p1  ORF type:complete len:298 (+),score=51.95 TRINITY_DN16763_c0_g1_i1:94-987(+)